MTSRVSYTTHDVSRRYVDGAWSGLVEEFYRNGRDAERARVQRKRDNAKIAQVWYALTHNKRAR